MNKIIFALLLGISTVSLAAVVPVQKPTIKRPSVTRVDASKVKMEVRKPQLDDTLGMETVEEMERYNGVVAMDNVEDLEKIGALMQGNPDELIRQVYGADLKAQGITTKEPELLTGENMPAYERTIKTDDPAAKMASFRVPEMMGTYESLQESREELKKAHDDARKKLELIGKQRLGEKTVATRPVPSKELTESMGISEDSLPKNIRGQLQQLRAAQEKAANPAGLQPKK